jgi:hypothetical protein
MTIADWCRILEDGEWIVNAHAALHKHFVTCVENASTTIDD